MIKDNNSILKIKIKNDSDDTNKTRRKEITTTHYD